MKLADLSKAFYITKAVLERENLWPGEESAAPIDYAISGSQIVSEMPYDYEIGFSTDFGGSEGVYTDISLRLWDGKDAEPRMVSLGTIKTLRQDRAALACLASLGANFVYYCRKEVASLLEKTFPSQRIRYQILSMDTDDTVFKATTRDPQVVLENVGAFATSYKVIAEDEIQTGHYPSDKTLCDYLLSKSQLETAFPLAETDIIKICKGTVDHHFGETVSYIYCGDRTFQKIAM